VLIHTCHAMPCRGLEKSRSERHGGGMARARHGMCESNTAALCKLNGKDTLQTLSGTAWQENGMGAAWYCELVLSRRARGTTVRIPAAARDFSLLQNAQTGSGGHSASYSMGTGKFLPGVKRQGPTDIDYSLPSSAAVKNEWSYTSTPPSPLFPHV
jgi:hypothetical protein